MFSENSRLIISYIIILSLGLILAIGAAMVAVSIVVSSVSSGSTYHKISQEMGNASIEHLYIIEVNAMGKMSNYYHIADGNETRLDYDIDYLIATALSHNLTKLIIVHNHPMGNNLNPSPDDKLWINITSDEAKKSGIIVMDSVIIDSQGNSRSVWK